MDQNQAVMCKTAHTSPDPRQIDARFVQDTPAREQARKPMGGQPEAYIVSQLNAFSEGARTNDTSQQMRNIARRMSKDEIAEAAKYYASQKPEGL
jgi:cytochrome c553